MNLRFDFVVINVITMPDLFDNFFNKMSAKMHGGKTPYHYSMSSSVNTGRYYSYHENTTNNKSWLPQKEMAVPPPRKNSVMSMESDTGEPRSRMNSVSSDMLDN